MNRSYNFLWVACGAIALVIFGAVVWYLGSPLFINRTVEEAFPFTMPDQTIIAQMSIAEREALESEFQAAIPDEMQLAGMPATVREAVIHQVMEAATDMPDREMQDAMPPDSQPVLVVEGQFKDGDSFHRGSGEARIYVLLAERKMVLRLENLSVTNGPDLHVLLAENPSPTDHASLGNYLDLGSLKGNMGNQNYDIPADTDVNKFASVVIYCLPFQVVFATADLGK